MYGHVSVGQIIGILIYVATCNWFPLAGLLWDTDLPVTGCLAFSFFGGGLGGLLIARNRVVGLVIGCIAGPVGILASYYYLTGSLFSEAAALIGLLPGFDALVVYFVLRTITGALSPPRIRADYAYEGEGERPHS